MKKSLKFILLPVCSIIGVFVLFVMTAILLGIDSLEHPSTILLPLFASVILIAALVIIIIWSFKFSNNKKHIHLIIVGSSLLALSILSFVLSPIVNNYITTKDVVVNEEKEYATFEMTLEEFDIPYRTVFGAEKKLSGENYIIYSDKYDITVNAHAINSNIAFISYTFNPNTQDDMKTFIEIFTALNLSLSADDIATMYVDTLNNTYKSYDKHNISIMVTELNDDKKDITILPIE